MHDVACEFARAAVRCRDAQKQLGRTSLNVIYYIAKGKVCLRAKWSIRPVLIPDFSSVKRLGVFLLLSGWDAMVTPTINFAGTH